MNILIIGNGFDLAHHLETGYSNFLDVIKTYGHSNATPVDAEDTNPQHFFFINCKRVRRVYQSDVFRYMILKYTANKGWIDFENELREIVDGVCKFPECLEEKVYREGRKTEITYIIKNDWLEEASSFMLYYVLNKNNPKYKYEKGNIADIFKDVYRQIEDFIELFRLYICWINEAQVPEVAKIDLFSSLHIDKILTFNYTNTAEAIYGESWGLNLSDICYIHGQIEDNPNNHIVMGIGSEFYDAYKHSEFLPFFKFYQYYKYNTDRSYLKWLDEIKKGFFFSNAGYSYDNETDPNRCNIYIYGHSLDPTDENILLPFLDVKSRTPVKIFIYYHSENNRQNMERNLVKILGVDKFSKYLCGDDPRIEFRANK